MEPQSHTTLMFDGHAVPITTVVRRSSLEPLGYVAKSGVQLGGASTSTSPDPLILGFSCGHDWNRAVEISRWEVVERAFATWPMVVERCDASQTVPAFRWPDVEAVTRVDARMVSLGGPEPQDAWESTGLAAGPSVEAAASHAMCERLERAIVGRIWYGDDALVGLGPPQELSGGGTLRRYVWEADPSIGFVMSVIEDRPPGAFICGTALRSSARAAIAKADEEALMLLDSHLEGDDGYCDSGAMRDQLASLVDPVIGRARQAHVRARVRDSPSEGWRPEISSQSMVRGMRAMVAERSPLVAVLRACARGAVVRAWCSGLESLEDAAARDQGRTVRHPIC